MKSIDDKWGKAERERKERIAQKEEFDRYIIFSSTYLSPETLKLIQENPREKLVNGHWIPCYLT